MGKCKDCPKQVKENFVRCFECNNNFKKQKETLPKDPRIEDIHLQVCLKAAAQVFTGKEVTEEVLVEYSRTLLKKLWG